MPCRANDAEARRPEIGRLRVAARSIATRLVTRITRRSLDRPRRGLRAGPGGAAAPALTGPALAVRTIPDRGMPGIGILPYTRDL